MSWGGSPSCGFDDISEHTFRKVKGNSCEEHERRGQCDDLICTKCGRRTRDPDRPMEEMFDCRMGGEHNWIKTSKKIKRKKGFASKAG